MMEQQRSDSEGTVGPSTPTETQAKKTKKTTIKKNQ